MVPGGSASFTPAPAPTPASFADQGMRIALCTSPATVNDRAHNAACYEGVLNFIISRSLIDSITPLQEPTGAPDTAQQFLTDVLPSYDVFVCVGPAFCHVDKLAQENPDKYFILVDAVPDEDAPILNLCSISFAEEQCGFFAGIAAAMETSTGRVAVVNSIPSDNNIRYYYGFRSGVAYTNGNFGTTAEVIDLPEYAAATTDGVAVGGNFTGSASDQSIAYTMSQSLIAEGCDVLFVAADAAGIGAYSAAAERNDVWIIGSESDQYFYGSVSDKPNFVLTSVTKALAAETEVCLSSIAQDSFRYGSYRYTAADDALGFIASGDHHQLSDKAQKALANAYPMMQDGTIVPGAGPQ